MNQYVYPSNPFSEGDQVTVKVDPDDRNVVMIFGHACFMETDVDWRNSTLKRGSAWGLDKLKGTAKQAINPVGQAGERNKITRLNQVGVQTPATVNAMRRSVLSLAAGTKSSST